MHWVACENVSVWGRVSHGVLRRRRRKGVFFFFLMHLCINFVLLEQTVIEGGIKTLGLDPTLPYVPYPLDEGISEF